MNVTLLITALICFTLASGFFSGSETALFSLSSMTVRGYRRTREKRKRLIARLLQHPRQLLVTILMLNVIVNILVQNVAANLFVSPNWGLKVGVPFALTLLFGELVPKSVALPNNQRISRWVSPTIGFFHTLIAPLRIAVSHIAGWISHVTFFFLRRSPNLSKPELEHALRVSQNEGVLSREESDLLAGYLTFQEALVKELMRPREEILFYDLNDPIEELEKLFSGQQCSRVPVVNGEIEQIEGVIEAADYFLARGSTDLKSQLRKPFFVPENMPARLLLEKFAQKGEAFAMVVDEYGSVAGLITREDLIEVVVGEIRDRRDQATLLTRAGPDVLIASGKLELSEFNDAFSSTLFSDANLVTLGGWLTEKLGEVPKVGAQFESDGLLFHVLAAEPNRVRRIYVRRIREEAS